MKLLFYINTLSHGGAERVMSNLAIKFWENKNEVVFVTSFPVENGYELPSEIKNYFLEKKCLNVGVVQRNITRTLKLRKIIKNEKPDVVISFLPEPNFRAIIAAKSLKIPVIISVRNDPAAEYTSKFYTKIYKLCRRFLFSFSDGVVFQTKDAQKYFSKRIQKKSCILMNQVDMKFFNTQRNKPLYYCSVGRLEKQKAQNILIKGFSDFCKVHKNETLRIYGEGTLKEELKQLIKDNNCENNIFLMGNTNDVPKVMSSAKAFILTSDFEGIPNSLLEAMAIGLPVISTDCPCGGPKMVIENDKNGLLTSVGNSEEIKNALIKIESDKEFADMLGRNAKKAADKFRPEIVFKQWESYIQSIINI